MPSAIRMHRPGSLIFLIFLIYYLAGRKLNHSLQSLLICWLWTINHACMLSAECARHVHFRWTAVAVAETLKTKMKGTTDSRKFCSVPGCAEKFKTMFLFPKSLELRDYWRSVCKIERNVSNYMSVCCLHFSSADIVLTCKFIVFIFNIV